MLNIKSTLPYGEVKLMCDSHYCFRKGALGRCLRTEGSFLILNGLAKQYIFIIQIKRILIKGIALIVRKCSWRCLSFVKTYIPFCFTRMLIFKWYTTAIWKHKRINKELKFTKTFSIPSFGKIKIKLPNISCPVVKNLSTKLRIVGFRGAHTILKCSLNFCWVSLIWFQHKT